MANETESLRIRQIRTELLDALDYEETNDVEKARRVITLTKQLLLVRHDSAGHAGSSFSNSPDKLQKLQDDARRWISCFNSTGGGSGGRRGSGTIYHSPSCYFRG